MENFIKEVMELSDMTCAKHGFLLVIHEQGIWMFIEPNISQIRTFSLMFNYANVVF